MGERDLDIEDLIELCWAKLSELEDEAREALDEGDRRAYLSTMRVLALFLRTNASLLATREKLKGKEKAVKLDLATLLSGIGKAFRSLIRRRRK